MSAIPAPPDLARPAPAGLPAHQGGRPGLPVLARLAASGRLAHQAALLVIPGRPGRSEPALPGPLEVLVGRGRPGRLELLVGLGRLAQPVVLASRATRASPERPGRPALARPGQPARLELPGFRGPLGRLVPARLGPPALRAVLAVLGQLGPPAHRVMPVSPDRREIRV